MWETQFEVARFGQRIMSVCYTLMTVPPLADPTRRDVMIMSNNVETYPDGSKMAWNFRLSTYNVDETAAHQVPEQTFDVSNMMMVS